MNDSLLTKWQEREMEKTEIAVKYLKSLENLLQQTNATCNTNNCQKPNVQMLTNNSLTKQNNLQQNISIKIINSADISFQIVIGNLDQLLPLDDNFSRTGFIVSVIAKNKSNISINWEIPRLRNHELNCMYFNIVDIVWSENGCKWDYKHNLCECDHLSAFTVLMSKTAITLEYMEVITTIGLAFSIISLVLCLLIELVVWNTVVKSNISHFKHTVLVNIVLSLLIAHCCLIVDPLKIPSFKQWCLPLTILKHFFFLAVFFWTMCFSMGLMHQLTFYFIQLRKKVYLWLCFSFGYACPFLIVIVTVINYNAENSYYYNNETCWLIYESPLQGSIHFFVIPVGIIVLVNVFTMIVVISKLLKPNISEGTSHDEKEIVRGIIKTIVLLTPILGITWIFGFVMLMLDLAADKPYAQIISYAFTIFNSLQV